MPGVDRAPCSHLPSFLGQSAGFMEFPPVKGRAEAVSMPQPPLASPAALTVAGNHGSGGICT